MTTITLCRVCLAMWDLDMQPESCKCRREHYEYDLFHLGTAEEWLKTSQYWGIRIIDPDGWRYPWMSWEDVITEGEFKWRLSMSTTDYSGLREQWT